MAPSGTGELEVTVGGGPERLAAGDTIVLPSGDAAVSVVGEDAPRDTPPWIG